MCKRVEIDCIRSGDGAFIASNLVYLFELCSRWRTKSPSQKFSEISINNSCIIFGCILKCWLWLIMQVWWWLADCYSASVLFCCVLACISPSAYYHHHVLSHQRQQQHHPHHSPAVSRSPSTSTIKKIIALNYLWLPRLSIQLAGRYFCHN